MNAEMNKPSASRTFAGLQFINVQRMFIWVLSGMVLLSCQLAIASAGMLIVSNENGKTYLLFVQTHKHNYYEFPGGRLEQASSLVDTSSKTESPYETAVRETVEELRGYLGHQQLLAASSEVNFVEAGKYRVYLAQLPFFNLNHVREIKIPKGKKWSVMREVVNYAWVDLAVIDEANDGVVTASEGQRIELGPDVVTVVKYGQSKQWFD